MADEKKTGQGVGQSEATGGSRRRRFSRSEKVALYLAADGKCGGCGVALKPGWHGDHVWAFSRGGTTDVINGQALCPGCNQKKGERYG